MSNRHFLIASDFDQTLSFNDSGALLAQMIGVTDFEARVAALSKLNLVQQGGELAYLLLHDPDFRAVRAEHLDAVGTQVRLKENIRLVPSLLEGALGDHRFSFRVISAAPERVIQSALKGIVPSENIVGTRFVFDEQTGAIRSLENVAAGYGKVAAVESLRSRLGVREDRVVYVGDGSSDLHVMLHVNRCGGFTIAVSESRTLSGVAKRTVIGENALGVVIPILEELFGWGPGEIRSFFESRGLIIEEWSKVRTDLLTISRRAPERALHSSVEVSDA